MEQVKLKDHPPEAQTGQVLTGTGEISELITMLVINLFLRQKTAGSDGCYTEEHLVLELQCLPSLLDRFSVMFSLSCKHVCLLKKRRCNDGNKKSLHALLLGRLKQSLGLSEIFAE